MTNIDHLATGQVLTAEEAIELSKEHIETSETKKFSFSELRRLLLTHWDPKDLHTYKLAVSNLAMHCHRHGRLG